MDIKRREELAASSAAAEAADAAPYVPVFPMQHPITKNEGDQDDGGFIPVFDPEAAKVAEDELKRFKDLVTSERLNDRYERLSVAVRANVTPGYPFALNRSAYDESHNLDAICDSLHSVEAKHRRRRDKVTDWRDIFLMYENMRKKVLRENQLLQKRSTLRR